MQLRSSEDYPRLRDVVGVTICDFELWPEPPEPGGAPVPMLSRWRMQEQHSGAHALSQVQYVFLELPKYTAGADPEGIVDRWAYFFREAENLEVVPPPLQQRPFREALEVARVAGFTAAELDAYDQSKIAEQDARGALSLAERHGREQGRAENLRSNLEDLCRMLAIDWTPERRAAVAAMALGELETLWNRLVTDRHWPGDA